MDFRELINFEIKKDPFTAITQFNLDFFEKILYPNSCAGLQDNYKDCVHPSKIYFNNDISISLLAGVNGFSSPRENVNKYEFTTMEMAILDMNKHGEFSNIEGFDPIIKSTRYLEYYDGELYKFVPINLIQDLFDAFSKEFGLLDNYTLK
jgi:hypothetical protein